MKYNLYELSLKQTKLDSYIHDLHNVNYDNTRERRLLAFMVELSELANETRCFKFWSLKGPSEDSVIFEEYSDGIHFLLSIGNAINFDYHQDFDVNVKDINLVDYFLNVYKLSSDFDFSEDKFKTLFSTFLELGIKLGMSYKDVEDNYIKKYKINIERQKNKY